MSETKHACEHCTFETPNKSALKRHHIVKHPDIYPSFHCEECGNPFATEANLQRHIEKMHKRSEPSSTHTHTTVTETTNTINREFMVMMADMNMGSIQRMLDNTDFNVIGQHMKDGDVCYLLVLPEHMYTSRREYLEQNILAICDPKDGEEPLYLIDAQKAILHSIESNLLALSQFPGTDLVCKCPECSAQQTKNDTSIQD